MTDLPNEMPRPNERFPRSPVRRSHQAIELAVFLFLVLPAMLLPSPGHRLTHASFYEVVVNAAFRDLALLILVLYFVWRNREPLTLVGWGTARPWAEIGLGFALFVPFFVGAAGLAGLLRQAGLSAPDHIPAFLAAKSTGQLVFAGLLALIVAIAEETIFRGYLILRFRAFASPAVSVALSTCIFALGHGYEGSAGVLTVAAMGLVFAALYLWRKSLIAPMTLHFLQDFVALVLVPLLGKKFL
ncbi:MAG: type II CAAX endopeptidase family protein [Betaproteobacteria bacterium]|nr:type II CAAX endopeptidase family protein [Betaproteobacteria bacterium]